MANTVKDQQAPLGLQASACPWFAALVTLSYHLYSPDPHSILSALLRHLPQPLLS